MNKSRRWILLIVTTVFCSGVFIAYWWSGGQPPVFHVNEIAEIEVHLSNMEDRQAAAEIATRDPVKIESVLTALAKGRMTQDHKCGASGNITLHRTDGEKVSIGILSGHHAEFYEFRVYPLNGSGYRIYRTEREPFLHAMAELGLTKLVLCQTSNLG